jgi:LETM1 and EF-hand domain-containing protein 1, mitochondrial
MLTSAFRVGVRPSDATLRHLAVLSIASLNQWSAVPTQRRHVTTETRTPDTKPFPIPSQTQSTVQRAGPPPIPPQQARSENPQKTEQQAVAADGTKFATASKTTESTSTSADIDSASSTAVEKKEKAEPKLTIWQKVKKEAVHYWDGTKLLGKEIKISFRLALKMAAGYELSRRESRQLKRTTQDLIRLVPFSVFVIVPFAELLLPVALAIFPNLLPSTFEGEKAKEAKRAALSKTRKDVSNFLRTTIQESGLYISTATKQSEAFAEFFRKVQTRYL